MRANYAIHVVDRRGAELTLDVQGIGLDLERHALPNPPQPGFFVQLLTQGRAGAPRSRLLDDVTEAQRWDDEWLVANAARFVPEVTVVDTSNYPGTVDNDLK